MGSMNTLKNTQDAGHPWRNPRPTRIHSVSPCVVITRTRLSVYTSAISRTNGSGRHSAFRVARSASWGTESYALAKSMYITDSGVFVSFACVCTAIDFAMAS